MKQQDMLNVEPGISADHVADCVIETLFYFSFTSRELHQHARKLGGRGCFSCVIDPNQNQDENYRIPSIFYFTPLEQIHQETDRWGSATIEYVKTYNLNDEIVFAVFIDPSSPALAQYGALCVTKIHKDKGDQLRSMEKEELSKLRFKVPENAGVFTPVRNVWSCGNKMCNLSGALGKCGRCHKTHYCSKLCQLADWEHHKHLCKKSTVVEGEWVTARQEK